MTFTIPQLYSMRDKNAIEISSLESQNRAFKRRIQECVRPNETPKIPKYAMGQVRYHRKAIRQNSEHLFKLRAIQKSIKNEIAQLIYDSRVNSVHEYKESEFVEVPEIDVNTMNPKQIHGQSSLPLNLFSALATAYGSIGKLNGKLKYGESNFVATPVIASIYVDAIRRHLDKWMAGQEVDSIDNVPHFSAILANVDIILCARAAGTLVDDRPMSYGYLEEIEKLIPLVKSLNELHKDKNPKHYTIQDNG